MMHSLKMPLFSRSEINAADIPIRSEEARNFTVENLLKIKSGHQFYPPTEEGTLVFPGFDGGGEWGGAAADPDGILYINSSEMPWVLGLNKYTKGVGEDMATIGRNVYSTACIGCHGANLEGSNLYGNVPSLDNLEDRLEKSTLVGILENGKGVMPSFGSLSDGEVNALSAYLLKTVENQELSGELESWPYPYTFAGYKRFLAPDGLAAINPPWGQLHAIDLNEGVIKWQVTLGNIDSIHIEGVEKTGTENYGGPITTKGGLLFIAATTDSKIRAFDTNNGDELWSAPLPAPGFSTPATYSIDGKQYILQASGGGKLGLPSSDVYVAFALE